MRQLHYLSICCCVVASAIAFTSPVHSNGRSRCLRESLRYRRHRKQLNYVSPRVREETTPFLDLSSTLPDLTTTSSTAPESDIVSPEVSAPEMVLKEATSTKTAFPASWFQVSRILQLVVLLRTLGKHLSPPSKREHILSTPLRNKNPLSNLLQLRQIYFRRLSNWAFEVCDPSRSGQLTPTELYAGILLIHLHLARYAGVAACHPPDRTQVDEFFRLADPKQSGTIGKQEFTNIVLLTFAHIGSRMLAYYVILLAAMPLFSSTLWRQWYTAFPYRATPSWCGHLIIGTAEHVASLLLFVLVVPIIFEHVDHIARHLVRRRRPQRRPYW